MKVLNIEQKRIVSEILGNISVAWFTAGVISPFFIKPESSVLLIINGFMGLIMSAGFAIISLRVLKRKK